MALISNAPIIIPKSGDTQSKRDPLVTLTGKNFVYQTRISPRSGTANYFTISESPFPNLSFDRLTGKLSGLVVASGVFNYRITAYNDYGQDYVDLELAVRKRGFTAGNFLSELTESTTLQDEALRNLNIDPNVLPVLQAIADEEPPYIRNDFMGMVAFSLGRPANQNDVQLLIDSASATATSIKDSTAAKLSKTQEPQENITAAGIFVATTFSTSSNSAETEIAPSESADLPSGSTQWSRIDGDAAKIEITPPSSGLSSVSPTLFIESTLTVQKGVTVANNFFPKFSSTFASVQAECEAQPLTKILHYPVAVGGISLKIPVYKPA